jgi:hypothetical protein
MKENKLRTRIIRGELTCVISQNHKHNRTELYTSGLINRQTFVVGGKKRRKGGGWARSEKDTLAFLLPKRRARPTSSFFRISSFQPRDHVKISSVTYIVLLKFQLLDL